jgi:uncharacterized membrane protein YbhN (UPF0104 family)
MGDFFHAVGVFFDHLASVHWVYLAIALGLHVLRLVMRAVAWRTILRASYPDEEVPFRSVFGSYVVGVGINSVAPARSGDLVKLYLIKHRIRDSKYTTLAPSLLVETIVDFVIGTCLLVWAFAIGALPTHEVYSRLPSVEWRFFLSHREETAAGLAILVAIALIALFVFVEHGDVYRERIRRGFAILWEPKRFARGVLAPQLASWVLRIASMYYFLLAFGVTASVHNAFLAQVVDSLSTVFPATPGGAGTKQGLIVYVFSGEAVSTSLLLAFSVGMNIAIVVCNLVLAAIALFLMARTLRWKDLRAAQQREEAGTPGRDEAVPPVRDESTPA